MLQYRVHNSTEYACLTPWPLELAFAHLEILLLSRLARNIVLSKSQA